MPFYRKKPVTVEAMYWDGRSVTATIIIDWVLGHGGMAYYHDSPSVLGINTLEGIMTASPGDWIIRGVQDEFYPCKPDIFKQVYEPAEKP